MKNGDDFAFKLSVEQKARQTSPWLRSNLIISDVLVIVTGQQFAEELLREELM